MLNEFLRFIAVLLVIFLICFRVYVKRSFSEFTEEQKSRIYTATCLSTTFMTAMATYLVHVLTKASVESVNSIPRAESFSQASVFSGGSLLSDI